MFKVHNTKSSISGYLETVALYESLTQSYFSFRKEYSDDKVINVSEYQLLNYIVENSDFHPNQSEVLLEPIHLLSPLAKVGVLQSDGIFKLTNGYAVVNYILKKQHDFLLNDLKRCNKTAWILPDFVGHSVSRYLTKLGKHSDVGIDAYTKTHLSFYIMGIMPTSLLQQFGWMSSSGLLQWWPDFINRTDLNIQSILDPEPTKPNMSGNILVVFVLFGVGIVISCCCLVLEVRKGIVLIVKVYFFSGFTLIMRICRWNLKVIVQFFVLFKRTLCWIGKYH
jgi:hypothetical protein